MAFTAIILQALPRRYNLHSGTAQFWKQMDQGLDFPDPEGGFPGMHLNRTDTEALIAAIASNVGTSINTCATMIQLLTSLGCFRRCDQCQGRRARRNGALIIL